MSLRLAARRGANGEAQPKYKDLSSSDDDDRRPLPFTGNKDDSSSDEDRRKSMPMSEDEAEERELKHPASNDDLDEIYGKSDEEEDTFSPLHTAQAAQAVENVVEADNLPQAAQATDKGGPQEFYSLGHRRQLVNGGSKNLKKLDAGPIGLTSSAKMTRTSIVMTGKYFQENKERFKDEVKLVSGTTWPSGGFQRILPDGSTQHIVSYGNVLVGDRCVVSDGPFKGTVLEVYSLFYRCEASTIQIEDRWVRSWRDSELKAFNEHGTIPEGAKTRRVTLKMALMFVDPREVQMKYDRHINAFCHRDAHGEGHEPLQKWKEKLARAGSLKCALCGIRCGAPWYDAEGKILYHVMTRHFELDGLHEDHIGGTSKWERKQYELDNRMAQWLCCFCHAGKASAEFIRPEIQFCPAGGTRGFPFLQPPVLKPGEELVVDPNYEGTPEV